MLSTAITESSGKNSTTSFDFAQLKSRVLNRLIDVSSPPSVAKRKCFKKLVHDKVESIAIINMASVNGSSVEDTKNMILNFCNEWRITILCDVNTTYAIIRLIMFRSYSYNIIDSNYVVVN